MQHRISIIAVIVAIWFGFAIRLHNLETVPLRGDEAFSAFNWAQMPISQSLREIAAIEPHPPLTYVMFHIWNLIVSGINSPFALRMLSVLANVIGIPVMYVLCRYLTRKPVLAILAAFMWALHPFEVWHSQDFRNYALWAGLSASTLWLGIRLMTSMRPIDWALYIAFATITAFTFYTEILMIGALGLYMIITRRKHAPFLRKLIGVQFIIVLAVLAGFVIFQWNLLNDGGYGGNVEPFFAPDYLTRFLPTLAIGDTIPMQFTNLWIPLTLITGLLVTIIFRFYRPVAILTICLLAIPLILLGIASTRIDIFHPRYVLATVPAFILLFSIGSYALAKTLSRYIPVDRNLATLIIASPWFVISALSLNNYFNNPTTQKSPAWDELGGFLNTNVTENDLVIQLSSDPAFRYYYWGQATDIYLPETPSQSQSDIIARLESAREEYDSLYIVSNPIPTWQNASVIEEWANRHMQLVRLSSTSGLGIRQYKTWDVSDLDTNTPLARFDSIVELVDYKLFDEPLPTGELVLWLYWRPLKQTDTPLKSFVHLVGEVNTSTGSPLWSQDDQFPQDSRLSTTTWEQNIVYRDVYYLSANSLQSGEYQIVTGWYDPETDTRIPIDTDADAFDLTTLSYP